MSSFFANLPRVVKNLEKLDEKFHLFHYKWDHNTVVSPLSMARCPYPTSNLPTAKWLLKVAERVVEVILNTIEVDILGDKETKNQLIRNAQLLKGQVEREAVNLTTLTRVVGDIVQYGRVTAGGGDRPKNMEEYAQLFKVIGLPGVSTDYNQDSVFTAMRTAGPNPLLIERYSMALPNFPVTEKQYQFVMPGDTFEAAMKEGRLYICDYKLLDILQTDPTAQPVKYAYAPIALFAAHKNTGTLLPVAIQTQQKPGKDNPVYLADGSYDWLIAKTIVEMADGNFHETVSHLGRTHLYIEPFVVGTGRNFSENHPIAKLLWPHFEGTLNINFLATKTLLSKGGAVDVLLDGTIESLLKLTVQGVEEYPFNDKFLPETFAERGVNELKDYAYRDDAMLYWNAIKKWVTGYLDAAYTQPIGQDKELRAWYEDLVDPNGGRVKGFGENGGPIATKNYLINALTMIVYTSSVQHAAVNFPQYDLMSYCPNMPLAAYSQFPKTAGGNPVPAQAQDYLNILPPMGTALTQVNVGFTLGSIHYTELGDYESGQFSQPVTNGPLAAFKNDLQSIGETIRTRNTNRRPYTPLLPEGIPQSINI